MFMKDQKYHRSTIDHHVYKKEFLASLSFFCCVDDMLIFRHEINFIGQLKIDMSQFSFMKDLRSI